MWDEHDGIRTDQYPLRLAYRAVLSISIKNEKYSKTELRFGEISTDQSLKVTTFGEISTGVGAKQRGIGEFSTNIRIARR